MAKKKATAVVDKDDELIASIAMATGGEVMSERDDASYYVDLGSLAANYILSGKFLHGGLPGGRIIEIYGPSSSGKSYLAANAIHGCQKLGGIAVVLDCENATNADFMAKTSHVKLKRIIRYAPKSLEQAFLKIHNVVRSIRSKYPKEVPVLIVYDSISVSPCERELKENNLPEGYQASDWKKIVGRKEQPGERARVCGNELRKVQSVLEEHNITLLVINQVRDNVGVMYGDPERTGGGGRALPFYAAVRFRTASRKKIENKKLGMFAGVNMKVQNKKNRLFRPFVESEGIKLFFQHGVNPITGILSLLIQEERITGNKGVWNVAEPYLPEGREKYTFKANREENAVPLQVLLDCPKLVDASSREELETYLEPFREAIACSEDSSYQEKSIKFDDMGNPTDADDDMMNEMEEMEE